MYDYSFYCREGDLIQNDLELDEDEDCVNDNVVYARKKYNYL